MMQNTDRLYFAYGSNMHVNQMVTRCPGSTFVGKATLRGWKWQINQRGYANVVKTNNPRNKVEGVVYRLTASDEAQLDLSEGVALGCYEKYVQLVNLVINGSWHGMRAEELEEVLDREEERHVQAEQWLAEMKNNKCRPGVTRTQVLAAAGFKADDLTLERPRDPEDVDQIRPVGFYASTRFYVDGVIQDKEYQFRIESAAVDAFYLGVSNDFIVANMQRHFNSDLYSAMTGVSVDLPDDGRPL